MESKYKKALREFYALDGVNKDVLRQKSVSDLVYAAQFELDLCEDGSSELPDLTIAEIKAFIARYRAPKKSSKKI